MESGPVHTASWRSKAEDALDRLNHLRVTWCADPLWKRAWMRHAAAVERISVRWPARLARHAASVADPGLLVACEGALPAPPMPRRYLTPDRVGELLAGDPAAQPWRPAARPAIERLVAEGRGLEIRDDGAWLVWNPTAGAPPPPPYLPPALLRQLFEELARSAAGKGALLRELEEPSPLRLPRRPRTSAEAREQYLGARTAYTRQRIAIRRGHRRREDLVRAVAAAAVAFRLSWSNLWLGRVGDVAGNEAAALDLATQIHQDAVRALAALDGRPLDELRTRAAPKHRTRARKP